MKKNRLSVLLAILVSLAFVTTVIAQGEEEIKLSLSRDFGYSSGTGDIQGTFSMKVIGPDNLVKVQFYIDDTMIAEDTEPPYKVQFSTDNYSLGRHTMYAVGFTADGRELRTRQVTANYVSADESWQSAAKIIGPVLGLVLVAALLSAIVPALGGGRKKGKLLPPGERNYGIAGGTICPSCSFPFALNLLSPNMLVGKLTRCPNCGKWFIGRSVQKEALRDAEEAAWAQAHGEPQVKKMTEEDKLQKEIDDSRYRGI